jgi:hypothetical protein
MKLGGTVTATSGGNTALNGVSNYKQIFTGTLSQTTTFPNTAILEVGMGYEIENNSTDNITVKTATLITIGTVLPGTTGQFICVSKSNDNASSWDFKTVGFDNTATLTATAFVKSGGTSSQFLKADGSVDTNGYVTVANAVAENYAPQEIIPLDNLKYQFDGLEDRFYPSYQGDTVTVGNPNRVEVVINGLQQPIYTPDYVWGTPFSGDGFMIDYEGYIAFSEVPPAGSTFSGKILPGAVTSTLDNRYPFKAQDILLGAY